jgi:hypothetical protein
VPHQAQHRLDRHRPAHGLAGVQPQGAQARPVAPCRGGALTSPSAAAPAAASASTPWSPRARSQPGARSPRWPASTAVGRRTPWARPP